MRIGIISPYPEFTNLARELTAELGIPARIEEGVLTRGVAIATRWEAEGAVDLIVARGPTALMVRKAVSLPVTMIKITGYDMVDALYRARLVGGRIGLIDYAHKTRDYSLEHLGRIAGVEFESLLYRTPAELRRLLLQAVESGFDTIVGTGICIVEMARERNLQGVLVHTGREALYQALQHAIVQAHLEEKEQARARRVQTVLDVASDGILAVDEEGDVIILNCSAERLLSVNAREVVGRKASDLTNHPLFGPLVSDAHPLRAELVKFKDLTLVVNRVPLGGGSLVVTFQAAAQIQSLETKIRTQLHTKGLVARYAFEGLIGRSPPFRRAVERARQFAATEFAALLTGESGTGKELFAHAIHRASRRANGPFVAVNCAALPENLLESELFGYEEGAFTGARKGGKTGLFELAHGGTIFLDEVGEVSPGLQARLLRVLQHREVMRVGGDRLIPVDVRVVAATNRNLADAVAQGRFREDLYYRLNVLHLHLPALRERLEDVPLLARAILASLNRADGLQLTIPDAAFRLLTEYDWPGNVREMENVIRRYTVLSQGSGDPAAVMADLMREMRGQSCRSMAASSQSHILVELGTLEEMELQILRHVDMQTGHDRTATARKLGISRTTLWKKLKSASHVEH